MKKKTNEPQKKSNPSEVAPKGTIKYVTENGKRMAYTSLGGGNWQGNEVVKPKMTKVKQAPAYNSKTRTVSKRVYGGKTSK